MFEDNVLERDDFSIDQAEGLQSAPASLRETTPHQSPAAWQPPSPSELHAGAAAGGRQAAPERPAASAACLSHRCGVARRCPRGRLSLSGLRQDISSRPMMPSSRRGSTALAPKVSGYHHRRPRHRQPARRRRRRDRPHRRPRLSHRARAGRGASRGRASQHRQHRRAARRAAGADQRQPGAGRSGAGGTGVRAAAGGALPAARRRPATAPSRTTSSRPRNCTSSRPRFASAQATLKVAQRQIEALKAQRSSAVASLAQAKAQRDQAQLNLSYTTVTAAQPGRVVNLSAAVGQFAQPGTNLTMFVPDRDLGHGELQGDPARPHAARAAGDVADRRLSGTRHPRPCRQRSARIRHRVLAAAGAERHRQLRQDRPARAGQDRHGQSADRRRARPGHVGRPDRARRPDAVAL